MTTGKNKAKRVLIEPDAKGQLAGDAQDAVIMATENTTQKIGTLLAAMEFSEDWWKKQEAESLIDRWERHVRAKLSERTWKRYRAFLLEFAAYLEGDLTRGGEVVYKRNRPDQISHIMAAEQKDVLRWLDYLQHDRLTVDKRNPAKPRTYKSPLGASSRKTALAALRSYYKWTRSLSPERLDPSEHVEADPVEHEKGEHLSREEMTKLLTWQQPKRKKKPVSPEAGVLTNVNFARERIIVWLLSYTGLRCQELVDLKWKDIDLDSLAIFVERGKGNKHRWVDILPDLERELLTWQKHQLQQAALLPEVKNALAHPERAHVLLTKHGKPIGSTGVWRSVKRRAARAKVRVIADAPKNRHGRTVDMVSEVSPHWLRRSMATLLLEQGVHLDAVADILGHADTSTTRAHYTNPHDERRRAAMRKLAIV